MNTNFKSDYPSVQQLVCIEPSNFQDGQVPQTISVIYNNRFPYNYRFSHVDTVRNYCYVLMPIVGLKRKKKKKKCVQTAFLISVCRFPGVSLIGKEVVGNTTLATGIVVAENSDSDSCPPGLIKLSLTIQVTNGDFTGETSIKVIISPTSALNINLGSVEQKCI